MVTRSGLELFGVKSQKENTWLLIGLCILMSLFLLVLCISHQLVCFVDCGEILSGMKHVDE